MWCSCVGAFLKTFPTSSTGMCVVDAYVRIVFICVCVFVCVFVRVCVVWSVCVCVHIPEDIPYLHIRLPNDIQQALERLQHPKEACLLAFLALVAGGISQKSAPHQTYYKN